MTAAEKQMEGIRSGGAMVRLLQVLRRKWFEGRFEPETAKYVVPLLLEAYAGAKSGKPLTKKAAGAAMGADDVKTARKYVAVAESDGYLVAQRSQHDKRKEHLLPSALLEKVIEEELRLVKRELHELMVEGGLEENSQGRIRPRTAISGGSGGGSPPGDVRALLQLRSDPGEVIELYPGGQGAATQTKAGRALARGNEHFRKREFDAALACIERALALDANHAGARGSRGWLLHLRGNDTQALADLSAAIALGPSGWLYARRGRVHQSRGQIEDAIRDYSKAIELDPTDPMMLWSRGFLYVALTAQYPEAITDFTRILELTPDDSSALYQRSYAYEQLKRYAEALADLDRGLKLEPNWPDALVSRSSVLCSLNRLDEAFSDLSKALALADDEKRWSIFIKRASLLEERGDIAGALADLQSAARLRPDEAFVAEEARRLREILT